MSTVTDLLWAQLPEPVFISRDEFEDGLRDWTIEPVEIDGALAFAALQNGPEFHFASFGTGARITRTMIWNRLNPILDQYGYVTTTTPMNDTRQRRLNLALGFKEVGENEFFVHSRLERSCP